MNESTNRMESPLDVLSRAASMVQTDEANREAALKRTMDRESSPCDQPNKILKPEPGEIERPALTPLMNYPDRNGENYNNKKCAGTQTPFSSFNGEHSTNRHDPYHHNNEPYILDLDQRCHNGHQRPLVGQPTNSSYHMTSMSGHYSEQECDNHNMPLNLTMTTGSSSSSTNSSPSPRQQSRPSVITVAPSSLITSRTNNNNYGSNTNSAMMGVDGLRRREVVFGDGSDPAIDEHFRRSLGKDYSEFFSSPSPAMTPSPVAVPMSLSPSARSRSRSPPEPPATTNAVSITGSSSVDDHFAKSLGGETWSQIKAQTDPVHLDIFAGSVDDHFAKALGDTWLRIKAEKEEGGGSDGSPANSTAASPPQRSPETTSNQSHTSMVHS